MIQKIWSHKLRQKLIPYMTKVYYKELQNDLTKIFVFFVVANSPIGVCDILTEEILIANFCLLKIETAHRFMRHQNEHSKRVK